MRKLKSLGQAVFGEPQACPACGARSLELTFGEKIENGKRYAVVDYAHAWCRTCGTTHETEPPDHDRGMEGIVSATIEGYEQDMGVLRIQAIHQGGEALVDHVDARLGAAIRLLDLVRAGTLSLTPMVTRDVENSIREARKLIGVGHVRE